LDVSCYGSRCGRRLPGGCRRGGWWVGLAWPGRPRRGPGSTQPATDPVRDTPATAPVAAEIEPVDHYAQVRAAACGSRRDYALDPRPIASEGQATVFGALVFRSFGRSW